MASNVDRSETEQTLDLQSLAYKQPDPDAKSWLCLSEPLTLMIPYSRSPICTD